MILIFDPYPPFLRWYIKGDGNCRGGRCAFDLGWFDKAIEDAGDIKKIDAVGYCLYHGGGIMKDTVTELIPEAVKKLEQSIKFLPEYNDITFNVARHCINELPGARHILLCDTAFFTALPQYASTYAVPYELLEKGIRRYGGDGLCHQWAWEKTKLISDAPIERAVSVYLGNHTNMAAIEKGVPRETSVGFTNLEGIISSTGCGDIDTSIIFQLRATGMSFETINRLLSYESGFKALAGKKSAFSDILENKRGAKDVALREIYCYNILRYMGAFISVLGGVDALIFISEEIKDAAPFILGICKRIEFLGLELEPKRAIGRDKGFFDLAAKDSPIKVLCLEYDKQKVLTERIKEAL